VTRRLIKSSIFGLLLAHLPVIVSSQGPAQNPSPSVWQIRAQQLTDDIVSDASRVDSYDRALLWARLGEIWWREDPDRARVWLRKAVELLEINSEDEKSVKSCRLATARIVLGLVATRDKGLHQRLLSIISANKEDQTDDQRRENAKALADAALSIVASDPQEAERLGEASLRLGFSLRFANLLWRLRARDPEAADRLFAQACQVAIVTSDSNFFSLITTAAFQGPFSTDSERRVVLMALAQVTQPRVNTASDAVTICRLATFVPPLLTFFDALLPGESARVRLTLAQCQRSQARDAGRSAEETAERPPPETVDELLKAASETKEPAYRDLYLMKAAEQSATKKDFERALRILDSVDDEGRQRLGDSWDSRRWDYAASLACTHRKNDNLPAMAKVIGATPANLRAFARISVVTQCESAMQNAEVIEQLESARRDLERAPVSQRPTSYFALVRRYARFSPSTAPAVLNEAVAAVNRVISDNPEDCSAGESLGRVLTNQLLINQYQLPVTLLEADEAGVTSAIGAIQPGDKRVAVRLELLRAVMEQQHNSARKTKTVTGTPQ
jgi:hypothetical protein